MDEEEKVWDIEFKAPNHRTVVISATLKSKADFDDFMSRLEALDLKNNWRKVNVEGI